jgi:hypothetical protein
MSRIENRICEKAKELLGASKRSVYSSSDLLHLYREISQEMRIPERISPQKFRGLLRKQNLLYEIVPRSSYPNPPKRYVLDSFSTYELAYSIKKGSYLSHGTAAFLHHLTSESDTTIYVNKEQSKKPPPIANSITQESTENAFSGRQRVSRFVLRYGAFSITLLNGKSTGRFGVNKMQVDEGVEVDVTNLERTLIDVTVRPVYAGGVERVLQCYKNARNVSAEKLISTLDALNYGYPYHQAVGFYMQKAGFDPDTWTSLRSRGLHFDFYLAHGMRSRAYDPAWRIFYPKSLGA